MICTWSRSEPKPKSFFLQKTKKKCAYVMGGYNHPLHALIKMWISFFPYFLASLGLASVSSQKKEAIFFLIISLIREDKKKGVFFFFLYRLNFQFSNGFDIFVLLEV
jgi:hypothetical protein